MRPQTLYQRNIRFWLHRLSRSLKRPTSLDDIPDQELDQLVESGFDWIYLLGMWRNGVKEDRLARLHPGLREESLRKLGSAGVKTLCGSCFAICGYQVEQSRGGWEALLRLKERLNRLGLRLMLDFIPNHTGLSHPWARQHPDFYINASEAQMKQNPAGFVRLETDFGRRILAHGRDPYFLPWTDTLQLNYANPELQNALKAELLRLGSACDGLRCDMAMLVLPEIFLKTWGLEITPFWPAAVQSVKDQRPEFVFLAEVYWDLESQLLQQGFDYTYDKRLYDHLREQQAQPVLAQIGSELEVIGRQAHFLENHDERRAAAVFPQGCHQTAALIAFLIPGLRFFSDGQLEGQRIHSPVQFCFPPVEPVDEALSGFYRSLLSVMKQMKQPSDDWRLLEVGPAWTANESWKNWIAFAWSEASFPRWIIAVNYAPSSSQGYLRLPFPELAGRTVELHDRLNAETYHRNGDALLQDGLFVDRPGWGFHLFEVLI